MKFWIADEAGDRLPHSGRGLIDGSELLFEFHRLQKSTVPAARRCGRR